VIARDLGLEPVAGVTRRGCDLVVAADAASSSGKARKARDYGIPVIDVAEFLRRAGRS
jgi:DNA polymerase-3 subunit epsilon